MLVSFDGISFLETTRRLETLPALRRTRISRVVPVNPTLTSSAHISIATGATPERTGIVSNTFHIRGTPPRQSVSGFDVTIDAETLWEAARRQGKTVGVITFPGADNKTERRRGDWGLVYAHPLTNGRLLTIDQLAAAPHDPALPRSFSPVLRSPVEWGFTDNQIEISRNVELFVLDTTNDSRTNYDVVTVRDGAHLIAPDHQRWFAITEEVAGSDGKLLYGSWSKLLRIDPTGKSIVVYWGPISRNDGYPASYREMIDSAVGFWPGPPDDRLTADWQERRGGIDPDTFIEQVQRFSRFLTSATLVSMRSMLWDLILAYQPVIDEAEHQFLVVNDRQQWSTPENRAAGERVRAAAYAVVDDAIGAITAVLPRNGSLLVTGDHGLAPIDTLVRVNRLLVQWGLARVENRKLTDDSKWAAYTSGNLAHLFFFHNPPHSEIEELADRLRHLRASDGEPVFEEVRLRNERDHLNAGDIIATGYPRFGMSSDPEGEALSKTRFFGNHGGLNHQPEFHTILAVSGRDDLRIPDTLNQTEIAGIVSRLLGIRNPGSPAGTASAPRGSLPQ